MLKHDIIFTLKAADITFTEKKHSAKTSNLTLVKHFKNKVSFNIRDDLWQHTISKNCSQSKQTPFIELNINSITHNSRAPWSLTCTSWRV